MVRCKFFLGEIREYSYGTKKYVFTPQYDTATPEDQRFCKATPQGHFEMTIDGKAQEFFQLGKYYYFDATPVA